MLPSAQSHDLLQRRAEQGVIVFNAIVEIDSDILTR
jgi:hypothetical protein